MENLLFDIQQYSDIITENEDIYGIPGYLIVRLSSENQYFVIPRRGTYSGYADPENSYYEAGILWIIE